MHSKILTTENVGLLLSETRSLVTQCVEKGVVLTAFFAEAFTSKTVLWKAKARRKKETLEQDLSRSNLITRSNPADKSLFISYIYHK